MDYDQKKLREIQMSIMDEIVRICDLKGLRYCLVGGTCLGAVRHSGYIPWDDDIDIVMPRADFQTFIKYTVDNPSEEYFLDYYTTNPTYGHCFAKYCKRNTLFIEPNGLKQSIYVDVYVQDKVPGPEYPRDSKIPYLIHKIDALTTVRREGLVGRDFKTRCIYYLTRWIPVRWLFEWENKLMSRFEDTDAGYYLNYGGNPYRMEIMTMPVSEYEPYVQMPFENRMYNVPRNWDLYLRNAFGDDYMTLPPVEKRETHYPQFISFDTTESENHD